MKDTFALIGGSLLSVLIANATELQIDVFEIFKQLSATGVLAITFWWLMQRFEKRLDEAFDDYKALNDKLIQLLTQFHEHKEKDNDHE